jgi:hypothetical protein
MALKEELMLGSRRVSHGKPCEEEAFDEISLTKNFGKTELIKVSNAEAGHGGGDTRLRDKIFKNPEAEDKYRQAAGTRDGALAILTGVAARKSIETGKPVKIGDLTSLKPQTVRS